MSSETPLRRIVERLPYAALVVALLGCSSPSPERCPPPHPTFRLTVRCADGTVPPDATVNVKYSGGVEQFDASHPDDTPKSVFCTLHHDGDLDASSLQDASVGSGGISEVVCELWTDGPATVRVSASGYPDVEETFYPDSDDCGLVTTEETITLERGDGSDQGRYRSRSVEGIQPEAPGRPPHTTRFPTNALPWPDLARTRSGNADHASLARS